VEPRTLALDRTVGNQWLVVSGLAPGDRVIVEGMQKVRPGTAVREVPFGAAPKQGASQSAVDLAAPESN
jgi:membrane fusion protein (multidrug efflux system)